MLRSRHWELNNHVHNINEQLIIKIFFASSKELGKERLVFADIGGLIPDADLGGFGQDIDQFSIGTKIVMNKYNIEDAGQNTPYLKEHYGTRECTKEIGHFVWQ